MRLTSKNLIKLYKRLAQELIGYNIKIIIDYEYYFNHEKEYIAVSKFIEPSEEETIIENYFRNLGYSYNIELIYFLHELGHFWAKKKLNYDEIDYFEYDTELWFLNSTINIRRRDFEKELELYYNIPMEKDANDFIAKMIKEKPEVIEKYNNLIEPFFS